MAIDLQVPNHGLHGLSDSTEKRSSARRSTRSNGALPTMAGFWWRSLALQIDLALIALVLVGVLKLLGLLLAGDSRLPIVANVLMAGAGLAYWPAFNASRWKGTPGKRILNLRVTDLRGARITPGKAVSRHLLALLLAPGLVLSALTRKRQAGHDLIARTLVLKKPSTHSERRSKLEFAACVALGLVAPFYLLAMALPPVPSQTGSMTNRTGMLGMPIPLSAPKVLTPVSTMQSRPLEAGAAKALPIERAVEINLSAASAVQAYVDLTFKATGKLPQQFLPELVASAQLAPGTSLQVNPATADLLIIFDRPGYAGEHLTLTSKHADAAYRAKPESPFSLWLCASTDLPDPALPSWCQRGAR